MNLCRSTEVERGCIQEKPFLWTCCKPHIHALPHPGWTGANHNLLFHFLFFKQPVSGLFLKALFEIEDTEVQQKAVQLVTFDSIQSILSSKELFKLIHLNCNISCPSHNNLWVLADGETRGWRRSCCAFWGFLHPLCWHSFTETHLSCWA